MLNKVKSLTGYKLHCRDGEFGKVKDCYFDDHHWTVRYLVADTGGWLSGRQVLISPYALTLVNKEKEYIDIDLTKKQIEDSPSLNTDKPVSRQFEESYNEYYGQPKYWDGPFVWGAYPFITRNRPKEKAVNSDGKAWDLHLRSISTVTGYHVEASDGEIGHVSDFIIDDETWMVRYLAIDTKNWWPGKKVLISPQWIERVSWDLSKVYVDLTRDAVKNAPEYSDEFLLNRDFESRLHQYYKRKEYWVNDELPVTRVLSR